MQCSSAAPELTEDVRRGLPRGVEAVLFELLEKAPGDRPADAADVVARLAPFRSSIDASAARGTGSGRKTASGKAPEGTATPARGSRSMNRAAAAGTTMKLKRVKRLREKMAR